MMLDRLSRIPATIAAAARVLAPKPRTGPQSGQTTEADLVAALNAAGSAGGCLSLPGGLTKTWKSAPSGNLTTYREMLKNPTVALALAAAKAPVKAAKWAVVADKGVPEEAKRLVEDYCLPLRPAVLRDGLRAMEYGWQPFEIVWGLPTEARGRIVPAKLKPLLPDITEIITDGTTGAFDGLKNTGATLNPIDSFVVHLDGEGGDMHGRSRLENIREKAWWPWEESLARLQQYVVKAAGIIPRIQYPKGTTWGPNGQEIDNQTIALGMLAAMQRGGGVVVPIELASWAEGLMAKGVDPSKITSWQVDFIEARNLHGTELKENLDKFEALICRGLLTPERAIIEGQNGTKAEAETHGDVAISVAQDVLDDVICLFNWHLVDKVLTLNYGPEAAGTVRVEAAPIVDDQAAMLREIVRTVLTSPQNVDLLLGLMDLESAMEQVGLPIGETDASALPADPSPEGQNRDSIVASVFRAARALRGAA